MTWYVPPILLLFSIHLTLNISGDYSYLDITQDGINLTLTLTLTLSSLLPFAGRILPIYVL